MEPLRRDGFKRWLICSLTTITYETGLSQDAALDSARAIQAGSER
jgi:hypothetical protein